MKLTQNGNDILQRLVVLEDLLDTSSNRVVLSTDDVGVHDTGGGIEGVDGRVDTQLGDGSRQDSGGVQVSKGGGWGRVSQVVSGHIDGLHGGDGALLGGGDAFLLGEEYS